MLAGTLATAAGDCGHGVHAADSAANTRVGSTSLVECRRRGGRVAAVPYGFAVATDGVRLVAAGPEQAGSSREGFASLRDDDRFTRCRDTVQELQARRLEPGRRNFHVKPPGRSAGRQGASP